MKIDKVIFTIDDNPHYSGFWKSISKHYKERLSILPVLFIICDKKNIQIKSYQNNYGEIILIDKINNIPSIIQALIGKFYFTKTEPETTWLIGDLDLYPLQQYHFKNELLNVDENSYVHLNPYGYGKNWRDKINGLPGYFHVAKGKTFMEELKFQDKTFEDVCYEIYNSNYFGIQFHNIDANRENKKASSEYGWFCCEEMYTGSLLKNSNKLIELPPKDVSYPRIDRSNMKYHLNMLESGHYIDFHAPRPYEDYEHVIEEIISKIPVA